MLFPTAPVKRDNFDVLGAHVETTHVDAIAVRIGTRNIERFDAANFAKQVFCHRGIELVFDEELGALMQGKLIFRNDQMKNPLLLQMEQLHSNASITAAAKTANRTLPQ